MTIRCQYPAVLAILLADHPDACAEHRFAPGRQFRFDFAIPSARVAIEINGAIWTNGRHSRGSGLLREYEKMRIAAILGWRVLPFAVSEIHLIRTAVWQAVRSADGPTDHIVRRSALEKK